MSWPTVAFLRLCGFSPRFDGGGVKAGVAAAQPPGRPASVVALDDCSAAFARLALVMDAS